jgi:hypothetical protein
MDLLASGERSGYLLKSRVTDVDDFLDTLERIVKGGSVTLGLTDEQLAQWPASGSVLESRSQHRGRPAYIFGFSGKGAA